VEANQSSGTCKTLHFNIVRYGFLSKLSQARLSEALVKGVSRELLHQSDEIVENLKKLERK